MFDKLSLKRWFFGLRRTRADRAEAAEAKVRQFIADGGREAALRAIRALRNLAHSDPAARREAHALQAALDRLSPAPPRIPRTDTATRMLYRDD